MYSQDYDMSHKMVGKFIVTVVVIALVLGVPYLRSYINRPLVFVQMSDPQIGFLDTSAVCALTDSLMGRAVEEVNALGPELVVITGDLVNRPGDALQDSIYRVRRGELKAPVWELPGNHDVLGDSLDSFDTRMERYVAQRGYARFSVKKRGCVLIGIDSNCIKEGDSEAEEEQLEWLREEFRKAAGAKHIFVFLHCPVIREDINEPEGYFNFPMDKREQYIGLFKEAGVSAVFAGHTHRTYFCEYDGIRFYTAGPVGVPLGSGTSGFNVITVTRDGFSVEYR